MLRFEDNSTVARSRCDICKHSINLCHISITDNFIKHRIKKYDPQIPGGGGIDEAEERG